MSNIFIIAKKEFRSYFTSPIAYVVLTMFLIISGYFFSVILLVTKNASLEGVLYNTTITLLFIIPLITMKLFAEERKLGTLELLMTKPVRDFEVVLGKFFASMGFLLTMFLATGVYVLILFKYGNPDIGPILSGYLGLLLVGASFAALGIFASTLSENQIIAAVISFALILLLWILSWVSGQLEFSEPIEKFISYISLSTHFDDFVKGVISLKGIVFYLSFIVFWLFVTTKSIGVRKWK
jgi:ABC-2 type transport system permease protein